MAACVALVRIPSLFPARHCTLVTYGLLRCPQRQLFPSCLSNAMHLPTLLPSSTLVAARWFVILNGQLPDMLLVALFSLPSSSLALRPLPPTHPPTHPNSRLPTQLGTSVLVMARQRYHQEENTSSAGTQTAALPSAMQKAIGFLLSQVSAAPGSSAPAGADGIAPASVRVVVAAPVPNSRGRAERFT